MDNIQSRQKIHFRGKSINKSIDPLWYIFPWENWGNVLNQNSRQTMKTYLVIIHICIIVVSNILVSIPIDFYGFKITWAAFSFPLVIVTTDLTTRLLGKSVAQNIIGYSFPFAILSSIILLYFNDNPISVSVRIGIASGIAYAIGILIDINAFQFIREKYSNWWIAPALSTIVSNIIDSYSFFLRHFIIPKMHTWLKTGLKFVEHKL